MKTWLLLLVVLVSAAPAAAQSETDPIGCWWRTSAGAVRVGEPFRLVLTCSLLENESSAVTADQSHLDASVLQLPPFEVIGGEHLPDLTADGRRFFQYEYRLRLIAEDAFGKDVRVPSLTLTYRTQSRVRGGDAVQGRPQSYMLPAQPLRVLSTVPADAPDIRTADSIGFGDIDNRLFQANALSIAAAVLASLGVILIVVILARAFERTPQGMLERERLLSDGRILARVRRELAAVRRERDNTGWTEALAGRALTALRIAGAYALPRRVSQRVAHDGAMAAEGELAVRGGVVRGRDVRVSSPVTPEAIGLALADLNAGSGPWRASLETLRTGMTRLAALRYGRGVEPDGAELDDSMAAAARVVRRLTIRNVAVVRSFEAAVRSAAQMKSRAWAR